MAVNMREKYESLSLAVLRDIAKNQWNQEVHPPCGKKR